MSVDDMAGKDSFQVTTGTAHGDLANTLLFCGARHLLSVMAEMSAGMPALQLMLALSLTRENIIIIRAC